MDPIDECRPQGADPPAGRCLELSVDRALSGRCRVSPLWLAVALLCVLAMLVWVVSVHKAMGRLEQRLATPSLGSQAGIASPEHEQQIRSLESRLARVLGASVESKLRTLERSVERGALNAEELRLLESAAMELRLLQSNPSALAAGDVPEHPRFHAVAPGMAVSPGAEVLREIAGLRNIYYAVLVALSLFSLAVLGIWLNVRRRSRVIEASVRPRLPMIKSYQEDRRR